MTLSIIVPVLDEEALLPGALARLRALQPAPEILVVDGGSTDGTRALLAGCGEIRVLQAPQGRAVQMNAGARAATGDWLLFLHADTLLSPESYAAAREVMAAGTAAWGWFDLRFDDARLGYRLHALAISTHARVRRAPTGDQGLFVRRAGFEAVGGFPEQPLLEDVAFVRALREHGPAVCVRAPVVTSARRWREHGLLRTILRMWALKLQYLAGRDPHTLAALYPHVR